MNMERCCCGHAGSRGASTCHGLLDRRQFMRVVGLGVVSATALGPGAQAAEVARASLAPDHFVPVDKKLDPKWVAALTVKGRPTWYTGNDLKTIGMPIGGICTGQVYLLGDGRLGHWAVFNKHGNTGYGQTNYNLGRVPSTPIDQGFAVRVQSGGKSVIRSLDATGFRTVRFCGEYPVGLVQYRDPAVGVEIDLEAFSPFIPLNAEDSALPATVMRFTVTNTSDKPTEVELAGWLENAVCFHSRQSLSGLARNQALRGKGLAGVLCRAVAAPPPKEKRKPILFEDFEAGDYGKWKVEGKAFGKGPAEGKIGRAHV